MYHLLIKEFSQICDVLKFIEKTFSSRVPETLKSFFASKLQINYSNTFTHLPNGIISIFLSSSDNVSC